MRQARKRRKLAAERHRLSEEAGYTFGGIGLAAGPLNLIGRV
jgi:hypothetical protein